MDRILCKMATDVYPEGNGVREDLIKHKITDKPLRIIANGNINGIDSGYFDPGLFSDAEKKQLREHHGIAESDFVFIFVGRLVADKGINELVAAFRKVLQAHPGSILLLVGSPEREMSPLLKETEAEIAGNDRIVTAGFQTDVRPFFAVSDALAFPSYREGFPNVVLQAGAMGLPSVVTNISGCNEIIKDGVNGLIIPVRDVDALAGSMLSMIDDKNRFDAMRSASRAMIIKRFEQQNVWRELLGEYNRLEKDRLSNV